jgi:uncharacterized peroxidase-related enzyme
MAWIKTINEEEAESTLKVYYDAFRAPWGGVDNIVKVQGLAPKLLKAHMDFYRTLVYGSSPLTRIQREMIAIVIAQTINCQYCVYHHGDALYRLTKNKDFVKRFKEDYHSVYLAPLEVKMLEFAQRLTREPQFHFQKDIEDLQAEGVSDETILALVMVTGYFNMVDRIIQGLGVELEHYWTDEGFSEETLPMAHDPNYVS